MEQHAESFQPKHYPDEEKEPEKKEGAVIFKFPSKAKEGAEEGTGQGYEEYKASGGILSPEEYQAVLKRAANGGNAPHGSLSPEHAKFMAEAAGITLSPEEDSIYRALRNEKSDPAKERYSEMSDQKLLAETLRIAGNTRSLTVFMEKYPHIFN